MRQSPARPCARSLTSRSRLDHFACIRANWRDKASNLREIAATLNLGLDALVFADDNPAERALVRRELPEIAVPELGDDPAGFTRILARAGYFEAVHVTADDRLRADRYARERARAEQAGTITDMPSYLASLDMKATLSPFDEPGLERIVQLANKTNQFNLTTRRLRSDEVRGWMRDPCQLSWQVRFTDRFGDHGIIALMAGGLEPHRDFRLSLWLMSCRVFGREVEHACVNALLAALAPRGVGRILAPYTPTAKNGLLRERLNALGFTLDHVSEIGVELWTLPVTSVALPCAVRSELSALDAPLPALSSAGAAL